VGLKLLIKSLDYIKTPQIRIYKLMDHVYDIYIYKARVASKLSAIS